MLASSNGSRPSRAFATAFAFAFAAAAAVLSLLRRVAPPPPSRPLMRCCCSCFYWCPKETGLNLSKVVMVVVVLVIISIVIIAKHEGLDLSVARVLALHAVRKGHDSANELEHELHEVRRLVSQHVFAV